ncbi:hypothetical protein [Chamaesiphon sp.]|uniref:hypothetical protein n=1 Tax=Chamaesiphon sp. TaxID=2814140 RepID=UPI0035934BC5
MTEVRTVTRQIQQLEIYLNNLVSALSRGELPVNLQPVTQIFDNTIASLPPILNLSEDRFIDTYNDIPQILAAYAIDVTLSEDSYRGISDNITFNRFHRGNYWVIASTELMDKAWLVPNPLKSLSLDRMPSLDVSFDRDIVNKDREGDFHTYFLVIPALVQILPIIEPLTWKLLERGKITNSQVNTSTTIFSAIEDIYKQLGRNNYNQNRLAYDLDELLKESVKTKDIIALQNRNIISLETHVKSLKEIGDRNKYRTALSTNKLETHKDDIDRLQEIISQLIISIEEIKANLEYENKTISQNTIFPRVQKTETTNINKQKPRLVQKQLAQMPIALLASKEIISEYYHNISQFAMKYHPKTASLNKDSINSNRGNEDKTAVLEENNRGNYWIFNFNDLTYLVPVAGKYINQHSYTTSTSIFESHNYTPDYKNIQLVKPAIVSIDPNTNPQTWRIQELGELVFL